MIDDENFSFYLPSQEKTFTIKMNYNLEKEENSNLRVSSNDGDETEVSLTGFFNYQNPEIKTQNLHIGEIALTDEDFTEEDLEDAIEFFITNEIPFSNLEKDVFLRNKEVRDNIKNIAGVTKVIINERYYAKNI